MYLTNGLCHMLLDVIHRYVEQGNSKLLRIAGIYAYVELNLFSFDVADCLSNHLYQNQMRCNFLQYFICMCLTKIIHILVL